MECYQCKKEFEARSALIKTRWQSEIEISQIVSGPIMTGVDNVYYGIFDKVPRALLKHTPLPPWLAYKEPHKKIRLLYHFVDAPLPRAAACDKLAAVNVGGICPICACEMIIVIINIRFYVLYSHILAAVDEGVSGGTLLGEIFRALHDSKFDYSRFAPPESVNREILYAGLGTVLGHEFGHILKVNRKLGNGIDPEILLSSRFAHKIRSELDADRSAILVLATSLMAGCPADRSRPVLEFVGAELVLRIISLLETTEETLPVDFDHGSETWFGTYPSARLRWNNMLPVGELLGELDLLDSDLWKEYRAKLFTKWPEVKKQIYGDNIRKN